MLSHICSFLRAGTRYYFDFSTVVDAPTTCAMTLAEYRQYYRGRWGTMGMRELPARLARADEKGTSALGDMSLEDTLSGNRAGKGETCLTVGQVLDLVLADRPSASEPSKP